LGRQTHVLRYQLHMGRASRPLTPPVTTGQGARLSPLPRPCSQEPLPHSTRQRRTLPDPRCLPPTRSIADVAFAPSLKAATKATTLPSRPSFRHAFVGCELHQTRLGDLAGYSPGPSAPRVAYRFLRLIGLRAQPPKVQNATVRAQRTLVSRDPALASNASRMHPAQGPPGPKTVKPPRESVRTPTRIYPNLSTLGHPLSPTDTAPCTEACTKPSPFGCEHCLVGNAAGLPVLAKKTSM
jgi:hypothetical protein